MPWCSFILILLLSEFILVHSEVLFNIITLLNSCFSTSSFPLSYPLLWLLWQHSSCVVHTLQRHQVHHWHMTQVIVARRAGVRMQFIFSKSTSVCVHMQIQSKPTVFDLFYAFHAFYAWWFHFSQSGALAVKETCKEGNCPFLITRATVALKLNFYLFLALFTSFLPDYWPHPAEDTLEIKNGKDKKRRNAGAGCGQ